MKHHIAVSVIKKAVLVDVADGGVLRQDAIGNYQERSMLETLQT
jgi:hypothetical protein